MSTARTYAARAAWIPLLLALSACSGLEFLEPPPLETAFNPAPPPPFPEPAPSPKPERTGPPTPESARAEVALWLHKNGYKEFQVSALLGHARDESNFNACITGPGGLRYLFQWGGTRLDQLQKFANTSGCPQIHTQLAFADKELRNDPKFSCFWGAHNADEAYTALRRGFGRGAC
jgi:hypothetical protein